MRKIEQTNKQKTWEVHCYFSKEILVIVFECLQLNLTFPTFWFSKSLNVKFTKTSAMTYEQTYINSQAWTLWNMPIVNNISLSLSFSLSLSLSLCNTHTHTLSHTPLSFTHTHTHHTTHTLSLSHIHTHTIIGPFTCL